MSIPRADCSCLIIFTIESLDILCSALWVWPIVCPSVCRQACNYYLIFRRMMMWSITHSIISSLRSLQHYRRDRFVLHFEMSSGLPSERRKESERVHCSWLPPCVCCSVHAKRIVSGFFGLYNLGIPNEIFSSDVLIAAEYNAIHQAIAVWVGLLSRKWWINLHYNHLSVNLLDNLVPHHVPIPSRCCIRRVTHISRPCVFIWLLFYFYFIWNIMNDGVCSLLPGSAFNSFVYLSAARFELDFSMSPDGRECV